MISISRHQRLVLLLEIFAVIGNLLYTWLYLKGEPIAFAFAFVGSLAFVWVCFQKKIFAESALHVFYTFMAIYGFLHVNDTWTLEHLPLWRHILLIIPAFLLTVVTGRFLQRRTSSKMPYLDAFTTVFSIVATWLMVNFVHENWLYWIIIDFVAIFLYVRRKLYFGALLFLIYTFLAIDGFFNLSLFT